MMTSGFDRVAKARERLERVLVQYRDGLVTEDERYDEVFSILYWVLYPEHFPDGERSTD